MVSTTTEKDEIVKRPNKQVNPAMQSLKKFGGMIKENILDPIAPAFNPIGTIKRGISEFQQIPQRMRDYDEKSATQVRQAEVDRANNPQGAVHVAPWMPDSAQQPGQDYKFDASRFDQTSDSERFTPTPISIPESKNKVIDSMPDSRGADPRLLNLPQGQMNPSIQDRTRALIGGDRTEDMTEQMSDYQKATGYQSDAQLRQPIPDDKGGFNPSRFDQATEVARRYKSMNEASQLARERKMPDFQALSDRGRVKAQLAFGATRNQNDASRLKTQAQQQLAGAREAQSQRQEKIKGAQWLANFKQRGDIARFKNQPKEQSVSDYLKTDAEISEHYNGNSELIELYIMGGGDVQAMKRLDSTRARLRAENEGATDAQLMDKLKTRLAIGGA